MSESSCSGMPLKDSRERRLLASPPALTRLHGMV
jgi:hypothetical protein